MARLRLPWATILFLIAPLLAIGWAVFTPETIGAFDEVAQLAPWNRPAPSEPWDILQADSVLQFYPWRDMVFRAWASGEPPYWNPYALGGTPLLANSQSGGFYPLHILVGVLRLPTGAGIDLLAWLHLFWAGMGAAALARRFGANEAGAALAGVGFQLSPFLLAWAALPSVVSTVAWIPWALAFTIALSQGERGWKVAGLAGSVAMMLLAGHLQFAAYGLLGVGILAVCTMFWPVSPLEKRMAVGAWARIGLGLLAGFALAAPQIAPVLNYSQFSHRRNAPTEEGYRAYVGLAIPPLEAVQRLANPLVHGNPTVRADESGQVSTFYPAIAKPGANFAESSTTVGPLILLAALASLWLVPRRAWAPLAILAAFAFLLTIGSDLNRLLYFFAPGWSSTGSPGRSMVLLILGLCVLAGLGASRLEGSGAKAKWGLAAGLLLILIGGVPFPAASPAGTEESAWASLVARAQFDSLPALVISALLAVGSIALTLKPRVPHLANWLGPIAALAILAAGVRVRTGDPQILQADLGIAPGSRIAVENERWTFIGAPPGAVLPPNTPAVLGLHDVGGYDSLLHRDSVAMLHEIDRRDSAPEANGNMMFVKPGADREKLAQAGVTSLLTNQGAVPIPGPGRASTPSGPARIVSEGFSHLEVEASGPGRLTVRDRMMPGWSVSIDGQSAPLPEGRWREIELPEGLHRVRFSYEPPGLRTGILAAFLALAVLIGMGLADRRAQPKSNGDLHQDPL